MLRRRLTNVFQTFLLIIVEEIHSKKHFELYFAKFDQPSRTISVLKCKKKKKKKCYMIIMNSTVIYFLFMQ